MDAQLAGLEQFGAAAQDPALVRYAVGQAGEHRDQHQLETQALVAHARHAPVHLGPGRQQRDDIAVITHRGKSLGERLAAHGVEGDVHALAAGPVEDGRHEILFLVVDGVIRAERAGELGFLDRTDGGADLRARDARELDGHVGHAAGAGVYQHFMPGLDLDAVVQRLPRGDQHQRRRRGIGETHAFRLPRHQPVIHQRVLRVAAEPVARRALAVIHLVSRFEAGHGLADGLHNPRPVAAQHRRQRRRVGRGLGAHFGVHRIHAGGLHPHQHVGIAREPRLGQVLEFQHLRSTGRGHGDGFHGWNPPFLMGAVI